MYEHVLVSDAVLIDTGMAAWKTKESRLIWSWEIFYTKQLKIQSYIIIKRI